MSVEGLSTSVNHMVARAATFGDRPGSSLQVAETVARVDVTKVASCSRSMVIPTCRAHYEVSSRMVKYAEDADLTDSSAKEAA